MDKGLVVKSNTTLAPTKRFFRVGTAEVTYVITHTHTHTHTNVHRINKLLCMNCSNSQRKGI